MVGWINRLRQGLTKKKAVKEISKREKELLENYKAQEKKEQVVEWHNVVLVELL